jgi:anti-sigma factor RsiW
MTHKELQILVSCFVDGTTTPEEHALAAAHLEQCAECRALAQTVQNFRTDVKRIEADPVSQAFSLHVLDAVAKRETSSTSWVGIEPSARKTVFALTLFVAVAYTVLWWNSPAPERNWYRLITGTSGDTVVNTVLFKQEELSRNDVFTAAMMQ